MHLYCYENEKLKRTKSYGVRDFCLCEKVDEEYMRSLINRDLCVVRGIMKTKSKQAGWKEMLLMIMRIQTIEQKRLNADLWIILTATFAALGIYMAFQSEFYSIIKNVHIHILLRTSLAALCQFGVAGLGISIVAVYRKEGLCSHGLNVKGSLKSIVSCILCFIPHIIFSAVTKRITGYMPFQSVWMTKEALSSGFPVNVATMLVIATAWGFFEGFNYVVISDKINQLYPCENRLLNWGAIICAAMCILIHGMVGVTIESLVEIFTVGIIIYGMLMVRENTGNAWGCIFIFVFLWNAF